jgi:predicted metal-dependent phosphoesterase TrpH
LNAIEAYHSDHGPEDTENFLALAARYGMLVTGGSDFHGAMKPGLELGTGRGGNLRIPHDLVERLR